MKRLIVTLLLLLAAFSFAAAGGSREQGDFEYTDISDLVVEAGTFDVEIDAGRGDSVEMTIDNYPDNYTVYHSVNGSTVRVWIERQNSLFQRPHRGRLRFVVPTEIDLEVDNSTGDVEMRGIVSDRIAISTSTGDVEIDDAKIDGAVDTTTGGISIDSVIGDLTVSATTGRVELSEIEGDVSVRTSTGSQNLRDIVGDLTIRATTGGVRLDDIEGRLTIRTSTGNITGEDVLLTGDSTFKASTGRIEIDLENRVENLEFDLTSTTGSLRAGDDRSQRRLFLGGTGIRVEGETSTGNQRYF